MDRPALAAPLDVAGSPVLTVRVQAPSAQLTQAGGPAGQLVLFAKVLDVAPDGTASLIHGLEAPIRVADVGAADHRDAARHRPPLRHRPPRAAGRGRRLGQLPRRPDPDPGDDRRRQRPEPGAAGGRLTREPRVASYR